MMIQKKNLQRREIFQRKLNKMKVTLWRYNKMKVILKRFNKMKVKQRQKIRIFYKMVSFSIYKYGML